jgi:hypothetical protein
VATGPSPKVAHSTRFVIKKPSRFILIVLLFVAAIAVTATATLQVRQQSGPRPATLQKADEEFYTIADYSGSEPTGPARRAARKVRYNMRAEKGVDPKLFAITEERESTFGLPPSHAPIEPALPAAQSGAVIVGEVSSAQAFLTEDKTDVISEFTIHVNDLLKENLIAPFSVGDSLDVIRSGGGIRLGSGKVIRYGPEGKPLPKIGGRYLFFLKYNNDEGRDYSIITAYALENDRIIPLDGLALDGVTIRAYGEYQQYKGWSMTAFLNEVRNAIASNSGANATRGRPPQ